MGLYTTDSESDAAVGPSVQHLHQHRQPFCSETALKKDPKHIWTQCKATLTHAQNLTHRETGLVKKASVAVHYQINNQSINQAKGISLQVSQGSFHPNRSVTI